VEDDAVLAPDALLVAAALFQEKSRRTDIHSICLGGWSGESRILANPDTFLAVRSIYFQAMTYSLDREIFGRIDAKFRLVEGHKTGAYTDWSEEITVRRFIINLTQLTPSVGRMWHIGAVGMGWDGSGQIRRDIASKTPWDAWNGTITNWNRNLSTYFLEPNEVTDVFGFVCEPIRSSCGLESKKFPHQLRMGPSSGFSRYEKDK
jgi:alpha-1,6-mannosyl-glycoprotein beta-1,2-N-acetylglucosaminyltransferase